MGAQPKPRSGVASLARHDLPSRAAVMLTCAVCSLLRASCLFSRSHPPFSFPLFLSPSPLALSSVTHAKGLALASVSIATVQASIPQSGPRLRFGATPLVPCPFAFQPNLDSVCCVAEQTLTHLISVPPNWQRHATKKVRSFIPCHFIIFGGRSDPPRIYESQTSKISVPDLELADRTFRAREK